MIARIVLVDQPQVFGECLSTAILVERSQIRFVVMQLVVLERIESQHMLPGLSLHDNDKNHEPQKWHSFIHILIIIFVLVCLHYVGRLNTECFRCLAMPTNIIAFLYGQHILRAIECIFGFGWKRNMLFGSNIFIVYIGMEFILFFVTSYWFYFSIESIFFLI